MKEEEEWVFLFVAVVVARVSKKTWSFKDAVSVVWEEDVAEEINDEEEERKLLSSSFA